MGYFAFQRLSLRYQILLFQGVMHAYGRLMLNPLYLVMVLVMSVSLFPLYSFRCRLLYHLCHTNSGSTSKSTVTSLPSMHLQLWSVPFPASVKTGSSVPGHLITIGFTGIFLGGILPLCYRPARALEFCPINVSYYLFDRH